MKKDLLFVLMQTLPLLNEPQLQILARQHGIRKDRETDMLDKPFTAFLRRVDEGTLSRLLVEVSVVLATGHSNGTKALREAATVYKPDAFQGGRLVVNRSWATIPCCGRRPALHDHCDEKSMIV